MSEFSLPTIVVSEPPRAGAQRSGPMPAGLDGIGAWIALIAGEAETTRWDMRSLALTLINEGRRYMQTPEGARWAALLADSSAVENGWLLWNYAKADFYLQNAEPLADTPATMLSAALRALADADLASLLNELSRIGVEWELAMDSEKEHK
jgi:hypothetical protein